MTIRILTRRELNRALLERQLLLKRVAISPLAATEKVLGLQAQIPNPPYIGLWTRLTPFERDDLTRLMQDKQIVRAAFMRSTLHLMTAADHQRFRQTIQPALVKALNAFFGKKSKSLDAETLVAVARPFLAEAPRSTGDLRARLLQVEPNADGDALAYLVRTYLPLVQVPPGGTWGSGSQTTYTLADVYLDIPAAGDNLKNLFLRYLAAFGPASIMDFQVWAGMTKLQPLLDPHLADLVQYRDEQGKMLFDLPDMPLPSGDTPAPVRFVPEYDNLVLAHADRTRIIADADRPRVFLSAARVMGTILIDGFVGGTWKTQITKSNLTLTIEPFQPLPPEIRAELLAEAQPLMQFIAPEGKTYDVVFVE